MDDQKFGLGHGYMCLLADLRLFVQFTQIGWEASVYDVPVKAKQRPLSVQNVDNSASGKEHCTIFVNSWRGAHPTATLKPSSAPLDWEIY
jgi:hypothetical protein